MKKEFSQPMINRPVDGSLLAWYAGRGSRREGAVLADLSGKGNTGAIDGASWKNTPLGHSTLSFDGVDDVVDLGSDFIQTKPVTVSCWIKLKSYGEVVNSRLVGNQKFFLVTEGNVKAIKITSNGFSSSIVSSANSILLDTWYFATATRTVTGAGILYINGVADGSGNTGTPENGTENIMIGNRASKTATTDGKIDDIRIYNRVFNQREIRELYNKTKHLYGK